MDWVKINSEHDLPNVKPAMPLDFGNYHESELVLVAYISGGKIEYELAKFTMGRDSEDEDMWQTWYCPAAEDIVENVFAWMPFTKYNHQP